MEIKSFAAQGATFAFKRVGIEDTAPELLVWGHGWGQSSEALLPMAQSLARFSPSLLIDFPGFGDSSAPPMHWGTAEYADAIASWLKNLPVGRRIWIGHSFGCRVGIQLASRHPDLVNAMVLVSAAGLKRRRRGLVQARFLLKQYSFKIAKLVTPEGRFRDRLRTYFGSPDYRAAGPLRSVLSRVVNEDLSEAAARVLCPTLLIYGDHDHETPPEIGERFHELIHSSELVVLDGLDHLSILHEGRYQVSMLIQQFVQGTSK